MVNDTLASSRSQAVEEGIRQLYENGIHLAFVRHGNTSPAAVGDDDFDRVLSPKGKEQAREAGAKEGFLLTRVPSVPLVIHSAAGRARETAELMFGTPACEARNGTLGKEVRFRAAETVYPGVGARASPDAELAAAVGECERFFSRIKYAPLARFFAEGCTEDVWREYAEHVLEEVLVIVDQELIQRPEVLARAAAKERGGRHTHTCVCVFGHAEYSQALALRTALALGLGMEQVRRIADITLGEAEGILLTPDLDTGVVELLRKQ